MLKIHFLNVGKGNCTIIDFPSDRLSMIDIDNSRIKDDEEVLTDPIEYLNSNFRNRSLFRFILTHPDMDHLSGLYELTENVSIGNFWDTKHNKIINDDEWASSPYKKDDWDKYLEFRKGDKNPKCLRLQRNETSDCCWTQDGVDILSPSPHLISLSEDTHEENPQKYHHLSFVLNIEYAGTKVLIGGDASIEAWKDILNKRGPASLKADIFLAPHHGSRNNIHDKAFQAINPNHVIISVARGVEYDYDYYNNLADEQVYSTKWFGTIVLKINESGYCNFDLERNI